MSVSSPFQEIRFTVDAALFRELGERLVGQPEIALAELVKNSYDADACNVVVRFGVDRIEVIDNGHGMTLDELTHYWMRVGSPHKERQERSRRFGRPLTGSKGVGRLAAQFLARHAELRTVSETDPGTEVVLRVDWAQAVQAGDMTEATALYRTQTPATNFPDESIHGTMLILSGLNQEWGPTEITDLAREVWSLQPPFLLTEVGGRPEGGAFDIQFESPDPKAVKTFEDQMASILKAWQIKVSGELEDPDRRSDGERGHVSVALEFSDGERVVERFRIPNCELHHASFEVRVYELKYRQPGGIKVGEARDYLRRHGGVYVYDAGFRLPYYGPDTDWLKLDVDVARRLSVSKLLPDELQVADGLQRLATNDRLFGVVRINTAEEARAHARRTEASIEDASDYPATNSIPKPDSLKQAGDYLKIQVSRDRLIPNRAYRDLIHMVRWALDLAAMAEASRQLQRTIAQAELLGPRPVQKAVRVGEVLDQYREEIPAPVFQAIREGIDDVVRASETEAEILARRAGLLGSLATAGMAALAYEHEVQKQYQILSDVAAELMSEPNPRFHRAAEQIHQWISRARATRGLFSHLLDEENRDVRGRFLAHPLLRDVWEQLGVLSRGIAFTYDDIDSNLRLPPGEFAQWSALIQNLLVNAVNAVVDEDERRIDASSESRGRSRVLVIQDTGVGVDLETAEELFAPFKRGAEISFERRALGAGGSGLGLTIVRMIAGDLGVRVQFVKPSPPYSTAVEIRWTETP